MLVRSTRPRDVDAGAADVPLASRPVADVPGHWLLARLGKRVLRPGGLRLTRVLLREAGVADQHVVEFAPGMGRTAAVVLDHGPAEYIGVDADPQAAKLIDRLVSPKGRAIAAQAAASGLPDASADVVLAEGVLTIQSETGKQEIVAEGVRLLRPGGRYVLHELALRDEAGADGSDAAIRAELARAMHVHARPKTVAEWESLLTASGLRVRMVRTASLALLEPQRIVADEGLVGALHFGRNLLADKPARRRVRAMAKTMRAHKPALQAVGIVAVKPDAPAGVVRVSTFRARPGHGTGLIDAAERNARDARAAAGCLSAEVCTDPGEPGTVRVISRWESQAAVRAFLDWHEQRAHGALAPHSADKPQSVHYPVATA